MKIVLLGIKNLEKSIISKRILEVFDIRSKNYEKIKEIQNNYFEDSFILKKDNRNFTFINLPFCQKNSKLFGIISKSNESMILKSNHAIVIISDSSEKETLLLIKNLERNNINYSLVIIGNENENNFRISFKGKKFYNIPLFPISKSEHCIKEFLRKEFSIYSFEVENANDKVSSIPISVSIIGTPNSGKSSILNSIVGYERSLVSNIEGTTREEISSFFNYNDFNFKIFDTEGVLKKKGIFSLSSLKISDLVILVLDLTKDITKNILQIVDLSQRYNTSLLIAMNKLDLIGNNSAKNKLDYIRYRLKSFSFIPIISISAKKMLNFDVLLDKLEDMINQSKVSLSKKTISNCITDSMKNYPPPLINGKRLKIYYGIHEKGFVHKLIFFINDPLCVHFSYQRYISNSFRKYSKIFNLPIKIFFKKS